MYWRVRFNLLKLFFPTSWGIHLARQVIFGHVVLPMEIAGLVAQSALFLMFGAMVLSWGVRRAKVLGELNTH